MGSVRRAEQKDIPHIMALLRQVAMIHHNGRPDLFRDAATKYTSDQLETILQQDDTPVFVYADEEDLVQGYVFGVIRQFKQDTIMTEIKTFYIDDLCVEERMRGKQIGKILYDFAVQYAKKIGCYNLTLNVWALNERAMKFYESCGLHVQKIGMETIL